jgi:hypothetical protein
MATHEFTPMSGGSGSEVTFVYDDVTQALECRMGNDRGSPVVNVEVEAPDGTVFQFTQPTKTVRTVQWAQLAIAPKAVIGEVVVEDGKVEQVENAEGVTVNQKTQRFRRRQAIKVADRGKITLVPDGEGGQTLNWKRLQRQEVY